VRIDSFVAHGAWLTLNYTGPSGCSGRAAAPTVAQAAAAVTVRLTLAPFNELYKACTQLAVLDTVTVHLDAPLGSRPVLDGAFDPAMPVRRVAEPYSEPVSRPSESPTTTKPLVSSPGASPRGD